MGEQSKFHINADGSVTVDQQLTEQEKTILDIFKIEKSKGGAFAPRRMKKRALKYAKSVYLPSPKILVEKLMLDHYPEYFGQYGKTTRLIIWTAFISIFFLGTVILSFPTWFEYDNYTYYEQESHRHLNERFDSGKHAAYPDYTDYARWADERYEDFLTYLSCAIGCLSIAGFGIWQYRRTRKNILNNLNEK